MFDPTIYRAFGWTDAEIANVETRTPSAPARPDPLQALTLRQGFAARHAHASDRQLVAGGAALETHLGAGRLWSDALIAAERAVAAAPASRGFAPIYRRTARGRLRWYQGPMYLVIFLTRLRNGLAERAGAQAPLDADDACAAELVQYEHAA